VLLLGNQCDRRKQIPFRRSWLVICRPQQSTVCQLMDVNTSFAVKVSMSTLVKPKLNSAGNYQSRSSTRRLRISLI
jgi:hypothetical protein